MNKQLRKLYALIFIGIFTNTAYSHIISLFLNPYPTLVTTQKISNQVEKMKQPGRIGYYSIKSLIHDPIVSGIFATYAGYITISTYDGHLVFPNKQSQPTINLLFTTRLTPQIMLGNTIHHWKLEEETPASIYTIERKQDEETENYYWQVKQTELPAAGMIPATTIWILAQPEKIYVPQGIALTTKNENFILPPVYVKKGIQKIINGLYILNLKHFFLPVKKEFKREAAHAREITI